MDAQKLKHRRQLRRRQHVRNKVRGTAEKPRLSVFRSSKHIYAQLIDDLNGVTLASASSAAKDAGLSYGGNVKAAQEVGTKLAQAAVAKGITTAAFDRGHYRFHGRVKALAMAANAAGLKCSDSKKPQPEPGAAPVEAPKPAKGEKASKADKGGDKGGKGDKKAEKAKS